MTKVEQKVMAGVAAIYVARRFTSRTALECYALFFSAFGITLLVSLPHVLANILIVESHGLPALGFYFLTAITKTNLLVQITLVVGVAGLTSLIFDVVQATNYRRFA